MTKIFEGQQSGNSEASEIVWNIVKRIEGVNGLSIAEKKQFFRRNGIDQLVFRDIIQQLKNDNNELFIKFVSCIIENSHIHPTELLRSFFMTNPGDYNLLTGATKGQR